MKILITGINSSLGNHIARKLSEKHDIIGQGSKDLGEFKTVKFDLGSEKEFDAGLVDVCLHLAFVTSPDLCEKDDNAYRVNILGTKKILEYCKERKIKKFVFASTGGVYGFRDVEIKEDMEPHPFNAYSSMKLQAERISKSYSKYFDVAILRYFFPYGPQTKKSSLINNLIEKVAKEEQIILNNKGKPVINPVYISDLVGATSVICTKKTGKFAIFNIAGPNKMSIKEISELISFFVGKKVLFAPNHKNFKNMAACTKKIEKFYKAKVGFREGLKITISSLGYNVLKK